VEESVSYFGNPQFTHRRARKPRLYHHFPENHFPHLGQRQSERRIPVIHKSSTHKIAAIEAGASVWNSLMDANIITATNGSHPKNKKKTKFRSRLYLRQSCS
jgi:hypothetical protein